METEIELKQNVKTLINKLNTLSEKAEIVSFSIVLMDKYGRKILIENNNEA
jgi:hypothetical protein